MLTKSSHPFKNFFYQRRYLFLFVALLLPYLIHPFQQNEFLGISGLDLAFTLLVYVGIFVVGQRKHLPYFLLGIVLLSQALTWTTHLISNHYLILGSLAANCLFLIYIGAIILHRIIDNQTVSSNTIFASLCIYLLMGLAWAFIYSIVELVSPGSFQMNEKYFPSSSEGRHIFSKLYYFMYFSFTTITTLGYGDIIPASAWGRMCASLEAMFGQLYLVVLVSRLVGMHITQRSHSDKP